MEAESTSPTSTGSGGEFFKIEGLIPQPLNTLHLTERVIKEDHFKELLAEVEKYLQEISHVSHERSCKHCDLFEKRLRESFTRIERKLHDKELNNPYFLLLYELPFIFLDERIIAGFDPNPFEAPNISELLNKAGAFDCTNVKRKLLRYMGVIKKVWYLKIVVCNHTFLHIILASQKQEIQHTCIDKRFQILKDAISDFNNRTKNFSKGYLKVFYNPNCLKISIEKKRSDNYFRETVSTESIENHLFDRKYLDKALESISRAIWVEIIKRKEKYDPFRAIFFRTKRPDVNYLVIPVTPEMTKNIEKKIKNKEINTVLRDIKNLYKMFKKYFDHEILYSFNRNVAKYEQSNKQIEWKNICFHTGWVENALRQLKSNTTYKDIEDFYEYFVKNMNTINKLERYYGKEENKKIPYTFLTLLYKSAMEYTPLASGVAYNVGKHGVVEYSLDWHYNHPLSKLPKKRYPKYFVQIDTEILLPEKYPDRIDLPLVLNGKLFGVLNIYPPARKVRDPKYFQEIVSSLMNIIERFQPDIIRAFFLDVCANVTDILGGVREEEESTLNNLIKKVEDLIRCTHGIPRTYILTDDRLPRKDGRIEKLAEVFGCEYPCKENYENICTCCNKFQKQIEKVLFLKENLKKEEGGKEEEPSFEIDIKNPPPLLRERILYGQENLFSKKWYPTIESITLEKRRAVVIQLHAKPSDRRSLRENINATYLTEAIETGLRAYEKKEEIIKQGTRAAVAAIMGRNMSHNIGSHVLSYWIKRSKLQVDNLLKLALEIDKSPVYSLYEDSEASKLLFYYLKLRMDFIAEITTTIPSWEKTFLLKNIVNDFKKQFAILDNIARSEGFCFALESSDSCEGLGMLIQCEKMSDSSKICGNCERLPSEFRELKEDNRRKVEPEPMVISYMSGEDFPVAIPHGIVGTQAFYSILENFIRNSAKHGGKDIREKIKSEKRESKKSLQFTITAEDGTSENYSDFVKITIKDNIGNCNAPAGDEKERVIDILNKAIEDNEYIKDGKIKKGSWGIKEMKVSANFLRRREVGYLVSEKGINESEPALMRLICFDNCKEPPKTCVNAEDANVGVSFYLRKPKEVCIIINDGNTSEIVENKEYGIDVYPLDKFKELLENGNTVPHRFLIFDLGVIEDVNKLIEEHREQLPIRVIVNQGKLNNLTHKTSHRDIWLNPAFVVVSDLFVYIQESPKQFILGVYDWFLQAKLQNIPKILMRGPCYYQYWAINKKVVYQEELPRMEDVSELIIVDNHYEIAAQTGIPASVYYQGVTGGTSFGKLLESVPMFREDKMIFISELSEAAITKVLIADERIWKNSQDTISPSHKKRLDLFKSMGIFLIPVNDNTIDESSKINMSSSVIYSDITFFVIHRGIIEKMKDNEFINKCVKIFPYVFIDSGRGEPDNLEAGTRYVPMGAIESFLEDMDKYALIQTLFSVRRYKDAK